MRGQELRKALKSGEIVLGTLLEGCGHPTWPRFFSKIGLDYVFLDTEHPPLNPETVSWAAQAYAAWDVAPLVRIPIPAASYATRALDLGAHGVIVPYVETVAQVKEMIGAVKYRPLKGEAIQNAVAEGVFPSDDTYNFLADFNQDSVLIIMVESPAGISNLGEFLSLGNVDGVLIGPQDLSISIGVPEQYDNPRFAAAVEEIIQTCQDHGVSVGIHVAFNELEYELNWINKGCNIILHRSDTILIASNLAREFQTLKDMIG